MFIEHRQSARKVLKVRATVTMEGAGPVAARTLDISANGLSLTLADPVDVGRLGAISFEMFLDGKATAITAKSKVVHCFFSNGEFKVGFQFVNLGLTAMTVIAAYLR